MNIIFSSRSVPLPLNDILFGVISIRRFSFCNSGANEDIVHLLGKYIILAEVEERWFGINTRGTGGSKCVEQEILRDASQIC